MQSKCAKGSDETPHHTTWLTNAFDRRPKSSQSGGINWQLVGQQTHQPLLLSKAPGVDGNWLLVASNKTLHTHLKPKTSLNLYLYPILCFSSNKVKSHSISSYTAEWQTNRQVEEHLGTKSASVTTHSVEDQQNTFVSILDTQWSLHNDAQYSISAEIVQKTVLLTLFCHLVCFKCQTRRFTVFGFNKGV